MDIYETEREQVEALKKWWKENGRSVVLGLVLGIGAITGWQAWQKYQHNQGVRASVGYQQLVDLVGAGNRQLAREQAQKLVQEVPGSTYATLASLWLARVAITENDADQAQAHLRWVVDNASMDGLGVVARLRLARLALDQGEADEALALATKKAPASFEALFAELRGDILAHKGDLAGAREQYAAALAQEDAPVASRSMLEMKLDDLGGGAGAAQGMGS